MPNSDAVVFEIATDAMLKQYSNALAPMRVTESGIATDVNLEHPENAPLPMLVTELPIVTDVKL